MPRLAPTEQERRDRQLCANIAYYRDMYGYTIQDLADSAAMQRQTLGRRLKEPGNFTLRELRTIANIFNVSLVTLLEGKIGFQQQNDKKRLVIQLYHYCISGQADGLTGSKCD